MISAWSGSTPRNAAAGLLVALLALSIMLLRPACDVYGLQARGTSATAAAAQPESGTRYAKQHIGARFGDCCASVGQNPAAAATDWPLAPERGAMLAPAPIALLYPVAALFLARSVNASPLPPPAASFYIRSARILR